jgi:hypothetical protein
MSFSLLRMLTFWHLVALSHILTLLRESTLEIVIPWFMKLVLFWDNFKI